MNTRQAEYKTDIALLARQVADRDRTNTRWLVGSIAVAALFVVAVPGLPDSGLACWRIASCQVRVIITLSIDTQGLLPISPFEL